MNPTVSPDQAGAGAGVIRVGKAGLRAAKLDQAVWRGLDLVAGVWLAWMAYDGLNKQFGGRAFRDPMADAVWRFLRGLNAHEHGAAWLLLAAIALPALPGIGFWYAFRRHRAPGLAEKLTGRWPSASSCAALAMPATAVVECLRRSRPPQTPWDCWHSPLDGVAIEGGGKRFVVVTARRESGDFAFAVAETASGLEYSGGDDACTVSVRAKGLGINGLRFAIFCPFVLAVASRAGDAGVPYDAVYFYLALWAIIELWPRRAGLARQRLASVLGILASETHGAAQNGDTNA